MCSFLSVFCSAYVLNALLKFIRVSSFNRASVCDHFRLKLLNPWRCFELLSCLQLKSQTQGCIFVNRKIDVWITTPLWFVCWTFKVIVARWAFMKSHAAAEVVSTQSTNQVPLSRWKLLHWASIALFNIRPGCVLQSMAYFILNRCLLHLPTCHSNTWYGRKGNWKCRDRFYSLFT